MPRSTRRRKRTIKFICYPNEYWIMLEFNSPGTVDIKIYKNGTKFPINAQNIKLDDDDDTENENKRYRNIVKRFCTYFIKRYASHQSSELKLAAQELSAVYTSLGLKIWSRKTGDMSY